MLPVKVASGGKLRSAFSAENVGGPNYTKKLNLRRVLDREERREGWTLFRPNAGQSATPQALNVANVVKIAECIRPNQERTVIAATATTIYRFTYSTGVWTTIGSGFSSSGKRWQAVIINGTLVLNNGVNILQWFRVENATVLPVYELRENGVAAVGHIEETGGFLLLGDITYILQSELADFMNDGDPWGIPSSGITQRVPYDFLWSEFGEPTRYAPKWTLTVTESTTTLTLPWATQSLVTGDLVAVINGGPANGVLGGQTGYEAGVPITVSGATVTLATPTASGIGYPRTVVLMRWTDQSTIVGKRSLQGDGSPIVALKKLDKQCIIYRTSGIYAARYTGLQDAPWDIDERQGTEVPESADCIANVLGDYHVFPGLVQDPDGTVRGQWFKFNGIEPPKVFTPLDDCSNLWFNGLADPSVCFAVDNKVTKEFWFCRPGLTLALCYENMTVSEIDAEIKAAAYVHRPGSNTREFVLVEGSEVCTYGGTYLRKGVAAGQPKIIGGLNAFGDEHNEKDLTAYVPILASGSPSVEVQVKIYSAHNPQSTPVLCFTETLTDPSGDNLTVCHFRAIYFQDEVTITDTRDINVKITSRLFEVRGQRRIKSRSSQRNA